MTVGTIADEDLEASSTSAFFTSAAASSDPSVVESEQKNALLQKLGFILFESPLSESNNLSNGEFDDSTP